MSKKDDRVQSTVAISSKKIDRLAPVLRKWIEINRDYCDTYRGQDCPYWYNERATVSTFAGAVWSSGGFALEAFKASKRYRRSVYTGRADLWFSFDKNGTDYLIEAKYDRFSLSSNYGRVLEKRVAENIRSALRDAKNSKGDSSITLGVAFLVPYISPSSQGEERKMIADFLGLLRGLQADLLAIYVDPHGVKDEEDGYSYPCVAMVGKVI